MEEEILKKNNFTMPGEWEEHLATWLAWPNDDDYFEDRMPNVEKIYLKIIEALSKDEFIKLLVLDEKMEARVKTLIEEAGIDLTKIIFYQTEYVDVWIRDYGPTFIKNNSEKAWVKWHYSCYGGKFPELTKDNEIFLNLKNKINSKMFEIKLDNEGGAIESNGKGTLITTKQCLLENRNLGKTKEEITKTLCDTLGIKKIIWLPKGIVNDHTDGHIDDVARFVSPSKILCAYEDNTTDENYEILKENFKILESSLDQNGNKFEVIKLPMPHMYYDEGDKEHSNKKAPVSYANFFIGNKTILVSSFNDKNDEKAISVLKKCFPNKEVVSIDCRDLIYGGGTIHCITQQEPK